MDSILESRRVVISDDNLGPVVSIVSILSLILVVLAVLTRLSARHFLRRQLTLEDGLVFLAAVFSVGELVTVLGLDNNGLGSPIKTLSPDQLDRFQQYSYATDVFYGLNLGLTEISVLLLIHSLTPVKGQKTAVSIVLGFTALWTVAGVFTLLFQCHTPHTWQFIDNQCIDRTAFWVFYTVVRLITELALIILPIALIWAVKLSRGKKSLVIVPFLLRILVIIPAIAQLAYFVPANNSSDPTFDLWPSVFCAQITQTVSIITACFLQLKPFLTSLNSGLLQNDEGIRRRRQGSRSASGYLSLSHNSAKARSRSNRAMLDTRALTSESRNESSVGARDPWSHYEEDTIESANGNSTIPSAPQTPEKGHVIHRTTDIDVEYSNRDDNELQNSGVARAI
ncbi:hypothetical protein MMC10_004978 [Thelotrema lepadinum]|nr:hypothetical protein [Thelotrema lepadinum]